MHLKVATNLWTIFEIDIYIMSIFIPINEKYWAVSHEVDFRKFEPLSKPGEMEFLIKEIWLFLKECTGC